MLGEGNKNYGEMSESVCNSGDDVNFHSYVSKKISEINNSKIDTNGVGDIQFSAVSFSLERA